MGREGTITLMYLVQSSCRLPDHENVCLFPSFWSVVHKSEAGGEGPKEEGEEKEEEGGEKRGEEDKAEGWGEKEERRRKRKKRRTEKRRQRGRERKEKRKEEEEEGDEEEGERGDGRRRRRAGGRGGYLPSGPGAPVPLAVPGHSYHPSHPKPSTALLLRKGQFRDTPLTTASIALKTHPEDKAV